MIPGKLKDHPAETAGPLAVAVAWLISELFSIDNGRTVYAIAIVLSFVPALVTWVVDMRQKPAPATTIKKKTR